MSAGLTVEELNALIEVGKTVCAHLDLDKVLDSIMAVTTEVMKVEASCLVLVDEEKGDLVFHVARGAKADMVKPLRMKYGEGVVGWVIESGRPAIVNDVANDSRFLKRIDQTSGFNTRAILCVPLATKNRLLGAIEVLNKQDGRGFDEHDLRLCEAVGAQAAIAVEIAMLHKRIVASERLASMGQAVAGLAHCIKNVLNGISGGSYMVDLGLRKRDESVMLKGWEIVKKNSRFIQDLVLDMLTYSKDRQPEYEWADMNDLVSAVCDALSQKGAEKSVAITFKPDDRLCRVRLDPKGIQRCLFNLVSNAIDACHVGADGRVDVWLELLDSEKFDVKVSDNGSGIPDEHKDRLFQMFFSTKGSCGTGLGLAVTHKIVTEHKGEISVDSRVGQGTTFTVTLPLELG